MLKNYNDFLRYVAKNILKGTQKRIYKRLYIKYITINQGINRTRKRKYRTL